MDAKAEVIEMYGEADGTPNGAVLMRLALEFGGASNKTAEKAVRPALFRLAAWRYQQVLDRGQEKVLATTREEVLSKLGKLNTDSPIEEYERALRSSVQFGQTEAALMASEAALCARRASTHGTCWRSWAIALKKAAEARKLATFPGDYPAYRAEQAEQVKDVLFAYGGSHMWLPLLTDTNIVIDWKE